MTFNKLNANLTRKDILIEVQEEDRSTLSTHQLLFILLNRSDDKADEKMRADINNFLELLVQTKYAPNFSQIKQILHDYDDNHLLTIYAALELFQRRALPKNSIESTFDAYKLLMKILPSLEAEYFLCVTLNAAQQVIKAHVITKGLVNQALFHPREIFSKAIEDNAVAIIIAHNHPSNDLKPSPNDIKITQQILKASVLLGIAVLDHIIFSTDGFYSMLDNNSLPKVY